MSRLVAITGVIGSGKSRVAHYLAEISGCSALSCDMVARQLLEPDAQGWQAVKGLDASFILKDGTVDRPKLRQAVFQDGAFRQRLDDLLHPLIKERIVAHAALSAQGFLVVEVPLLYEVGWQSMFARVVCVYARPAICLQRLQRRDGVDRQQAQLALQSQFAIADKVDWADYVIDNSGSWSASVLQLLRLRDLLPC